MLKVLKHNDAGWDEIVRSFKDHDIYYLSGYVNSLYVNGDGMPLLFCYEKDGFRAMQVMLKRDIADDERFEGRIEKGTCFDLISPYGYGGWIFEGDADKKSLTEISAEVKELARLAREGKLPPEKLRGGTFTITNLGMYGIESFSPIINQPEVAILGVNTMEDKVVVRNGEMCIRPIMNLSLTADHRVVDGSVAAQFLQRVKSLMENPALILA